MVDDADSRPLLDTIIAGSRILTRQRSGESYAAWCQRNHDVGLELIETIIPQLPWRVKTVLSGCAMGADEAGATWAHNHGVVVREFPAQWDTHGKSAGPRRNEQMVREADAILTLWNGVSRGTQDVMRRARTRALQGWHHRVNLDDA